MAITQNTFTGDGSTTNFSFTFEYIKEADVKATLDGTATTAFTLANATTLSFTTAPANGVAIRIFRDTDIDSLRQRFFLALLSKLRILMTTSPKITLLYRRLTLMLLLPTPLQTPLRRLQILLLLQQTLLVPMLLLLYLRLTQHQLMLPQL